jgi:hypothetical protein
MSDEKISVSYPLSIDISISRSVYNVMNVAILTIYGLDETKRKMLAKDKVNFNKYIRMDIKAGYNGNEWLIYRGAVQECFSYRDGGDTEFKTYIESADAAMDLLLSHTSSTFKDGTDAATIINNLGSSLIDLHIGAISDYVKFSIPRRAKNETGKIINLLSNIGTVASSLGVEKTMSIDLGVINFLRQEQDVIKRFGFLNVDDSTGLLGTPRRRDTLFSATMLFEPAANLNQICLFESKALDISGTYKIMGVHHNGTISGAKCGTMVTTLDLFLGMGKFYEV